MQRKTEKLLEFLDETTYTASAGPLGLSLFLPGINRYLPQATFAYERGLRFARNELRREEFIGRGAVARYAPGVRFFFLNLFVGSVMTFGSDLMCVAVGGRK